MYYSVTSLWIGLRRRLTAENFEWTNANIAPYNINPSGNLVGLNFRKYHLKNSYLLSLKDNVYKNMKRNKTTLYFKKCDSF